MWQPRNALAVAERAARAGRVVILAWLQQLQLPRQTSGRAAPAVVFNNSVAFCDKAVNCML